MLVFSFGAEIYVNLPGTGAAPLSFVAGRSLVMGPVKKALEYTLTPGSEMLVVNFVWDAFYRLFGHALTGVRSYLQDPDELLNSHCFAALWEELRQEPDLNVRIHKLLVMADNYLSEQEAASARIVDNSRDADAGPLNPVKVVAGQSGRHERTVQLHYRKYLGYTSKEMARYQRFLKAVKLLQEMPGGASADWFEVIHQCGYYDQSHLIRDFKYFLDLSPSAYLRLQEDICLAGEGNKKR
jgi:AraC-like DNA-binding protein